VVVFKWHIWAICHRLPWAFAWFNDPILGAIIAVVILSLIITCAACVLGLFVPFL